MLPLPLLDIAMASDQDPGRSVKVAVQLVAAALQEIQVIQNIEASVTPEEPVEFDRRTASYIRELYERWAISAELLLDRIAQVESRSGALAESTALRDALGRTRARLSVSLDDMEQGLRDAIEGRAVPLEEVRRELRLRVH